MENISSKNKTDSEKNIDFFYIHQAYETIRDVFKKWKESCGIDYTNKFKAFLESPIEEKSLQLIWYEVGAEEQYETFRNLNSGKIQLSNTELIKALFLNRTSGLPKKDLQEVAAQFEHIEQEMQNDQFWYMFNKEEVKEGQTRMDFLFNLVANCKQEDYDIDPRWSFTHYFERPEYGTLEKKWEEVRHTYLRLKDMFNNIYCYHYIGFLTYCNTGKTLSNAQKRLSESRKKTHSVFIEDLRKEIREILKKDHPDIDGYNYYSNKQDLRQLFVMHNIETILQRYAFLKKEKELQLQKGFEQFPFDLLHKQYWDIEHIASNTDCDFKKIQDMDDWLNSIKQDLGVSHRILINEITKKLEGNYLNDKSKESFKLLYNHLMHEIDKLNDNYIKDEEPNDNGKNKMQVGNLTLLDRHTNRSYHNALFPRKRKFIIVAEGLQDNSNKEERDINKMFIPICTRQVFTKAYNKGNNISLNTWTQTDADAYVKDMRQKLEYYFKD